jgi:hypothetical protein
MSATTTPTTNAVGLSQLRLQIGTGLPGAPGFNFHGTLFDGYMIAGDVKIAQVTAPPFPDYKVRVHGRRTNLVFGGATDYLASLQGQYVVSVPPPAIGSFLATLEIVMKLDGPNSWTGVADITYAGGHLENVPVKSIPISSN